MTTIALRADRSFQFSVGFHVLFLLTGFAMQTYLEHQRLKATPVDIVFLDTPSPRARVSIPQAVVTKVGVGAPAAGAFSGLLASASRGFGTKVSGVRKNESTTNLAAMANGLTKNLLAGAAGAKAGRVALPGQVSSSAHVEWAGLEAQSSKSMTVEDREAIRRAIASHEAAFRGCHEKALLTDAAFSGQAELLFTVGAGGRVTTTTVAYAGAGGASSQDVLRACIQGEGRRIQFPAGVAGSQVKFTLLMR